MDDNRPPTGTSRTASVLFSGHLRYTKVTFRNLKCDICENRNPGVMQKCDQCGLATCQDCHVARNYDARHNLAKVSDLDWTQRESSIFKLKGKFTRSSSEYDDDDGDEYVKEEKSTHGKRRRCIVAKDKEDNDARRLRLDQDFRAEYHAPDITTWADVVATAAATDEDNGGGVQNPVFGEDALARPARQQSIEERMVEAWHTNRTIIACVREEGQKAAWKMVQAAATLWALQDGLAVPSEPPYPVPAWVADDDEEERGGDISREDSDEIFRWGGGSDGS